MTKEATILLTGFKDGGIQGIDYPNPTGIVTRNLDGMYIEDFRVDGQLIDGDLEDRPAIYDRLMRTGNRIAALAIGMANLDEEFHLETTGRNEVDTHAYPGHRGGMRQNLLLPGGPLAHVNHSVHYEDLTQELQQQGFGASISHHAGKAGCNAAAYSLFALQDSYRGVPLLFAHTPYNPETAALKRKIQDEYALSDSESPAIKPPHFHSMPIEKVQAGVVVMLRCLVRQALQQSSLHLND